MKITQEQRSLISEFQQMTQSIIVNENGLWKIDAPRWSEAFDTIEELVDAIEYDMRQMYERDAQFIDDYYSDPIVCAGFAQQDVIDMYRRER